MSSPLFGMPAPVAQTPKVAQAQRRFGLVRMAVDSAHRIEVVEGAVYTTARSHLDVPPEAKLVYFCQHPRCSGKTWDAEATLRAAHPTSKEMDRLQEIHVFGMWSPDVLDPTAQGAAKKALDKVQKMLEKDPDNEELEAKVKRAREALTAASGVVGLVAPAETEAP